MSKVPVVNFEKVEGITRRATGSGAKAFWYLDRTGDLRNVTDKDSNAALAIDKIRVWEPTQNQVRAGIICKVTLETPVAKIDNISIKPSKYAEGDIYLQMGGPRQQKGEAEEPKWLRDCKLTAPARAQILSYVHSLITVKEESE